MAFNVGELNALLTLDTAQYFAALRSVQSGATSAGNNIGAGLNAGASGANNLAGAANNANAATQQVGRSAGLVGQAFKTVSGLVAGGVVVDYLRDAVNASSDLNETISKGQNIFGSAAASVEEWGNTAATSVGLSKAAALDAATNFGNMFTQIGYTSEAAAELSTKTVQMAADLGSFNNMPTADVADKISAAFNGEYDSLQAMIPSINAARVETEAMTASGKSSADQLTAQEKATAVLKIVSEDGAKAMGDFARTSDGFANQSKITAATIEDQKAALGDKLMPVVQTFMGILNDVGIPALGALGDAFGAVAGFLEPVIRFLGDALVAFTGLPGPVQTLAIGLGAVALLSGPLTALWVSMKAGVASMTATAAGATGMGAATAVASAGVAKLGVALKAAFLSNPIGLALVGVATAFAAFSGGAEEATPPVTSFTAAIDESTGALKENAQAVLAKAVADSGSAAAMKAIGVDADVYVRALMGEAGALDEVNAKVAAATAATNDYATEYGNVSEVTAEASAAAAALAADQGGLSSELDKSKLALEGAKGATEGSTSATKENATATDEAKDAALEQSDAVKEQESAHRDLETAVRNVIAALDEKQGRDNPESTFAAEQATRALAASFRDQDAAVRGVDEANAAYAAALVNVDTVQNDAEASAADLEAAHTAVADAADAVRDAEDAAADSAIDLYGAGENVRATFLAQAQEAANAAGATGDMAAAHTAAKSKVEELTTGLYNQMIQSGKTDAEARAYIESLGLVPETVATTIVANGLADSNRDVSVLKTKLDGINGQTYTYHVNAISNAGATMQQGVVGTFASGGAIYGPGTGTSDSVPARLSTGEHVLTAADVQAMGGQDRVYAMRRSLYMAEGGAVSAVPLRMASGGAVGAASAAAGSSYTVIVNHYGSGEVAPAAVKRALRELERSSV